MDYKAKGMERKKYGLLKVNPSNSVQFVYCKSLADAEQRRKEVISRGSNYTELTIICYSTYDKQKARVVLQWD